MKREERSGDKPNEGNHHTTRPVSVSLALALPLWRSLRLLVAHAGLLSLVLFSERLVCATLATYLMKVLRRRRRGLPRGLVRRLASSTERGRSDKQETSSRFSPGGDSAAAGTSLLLLLLPVDDVAEVGGAAATGAERGRLSSSSSDGVDEDGPRPHLRRPVRPAICLPECLSSHTPGYGWFGPCGQRQRGERWGERERERKSRHRRKALEDATKRDKGGSLGVNGTDTICTAPGRSYNKCRCY